MSSVLLRGAICIFVVCATGCSSSKQFTDGNFQYLEPDKRLLVMPLDVSLGELTTVGEFEARADWSVEASNNVAQALRTHLKNRAAQTEFFSESAPAYTSQALIDSLIELHKAVGASIYRNNFIKELPTKTGHLDWTMGEKAIALGQQTGHDYALFFHAFNSYSTTERVAIQASVTILTCGATPICLVALGGAPKTMYFSLVDLHSGKVVWFSGNIGGVGDLRSVELSSRIIERLLGPLDRGQASQRQD